MPDSSVTGPMGNSSIPISAPARPTTSAAATQNTAQPAYFTASRRSRPAGAITR